MPVIDGYMFREIVGRGGYSTVFLASQVTLGRDVAVKVMDADLHDARGMKQFTQECLAIGRLTNEPHIITVFEAGTTADQRRFISMQYLRNGSVADRIARAGPIPVRETLEIGARVAEGLAAAHANGILHRDIKPGNILLDDRGEPVLSDFGIANLDNAEMTSVVCTPSYAPFEVLRGEDSGRPADLYALGATLYAMLTGIPPFGPRPGDPANASYLVAHRAQTEDVPPLGAHVAPPDVAALLYALLARSPADRPSDAAALARDLWQLFDSVAGRAARSVQSSQSPAPVPGQRAGTGPERTMDRSVEDVQAYALLDATRARGRPPHHDHTDHDRISGARSRLPWIATGVAAAVLLMIGALVFAPTQDRTTAGTAGPARTRTPVSFTAAQVAAATPSRPVLTDGGATVTLTWRNGSSTAPVVIQPETAGGPAQVISLTAGTTRYVATGLDATAGYCFRIGALLADPVKGPLPAWGPYACIRGAVNSPDAG